MIKLKEYILLSKETRQKHLDLNQPCIERGGNSTNHKGVLAQYLDTDIPSGRILLCHACGNEKCSEPKHLYWGTDRENIVEDGTTFGTYKTPWQRMIEKYGYEEACRMNSKKSIGNKNATVNKGKPKSEEHKKKIAESVRARYNKNIANNSKEELQNEYCPGGEMGRRKGLRKI
jgi:hypothetical protein